MNNYIIGIDPYQNDNSKGACHIYKINNMKKEYIYPEVKKEVVEEEDFKIYTLNTIIRIPVKGIYHKVFLKKQISIVKSDYNVVSLDQFLLQLSEDFHTEVYRAINFYDGYKEPLKEYIDENQISEKERLKLKYN